MKPETNSLLASIAAANVLLCGAAPGQSGTIANWKEFNAGSINSGMDTDSPTIGDGSASNADNAWVAGRFGTVASPVSVTLAVGETLTVSGSVVLTGGGGNNDQFRFGVFDDSGQFAADGITWSNGGWIYEPQDGIYQARTNGVFVSTNPNASRISPDSSPDNDGWSANSTAAYDWSFSVTRDSATTVDLVATLTGGDNGISRTSTVNDQATSLFTYTAVGVLFGGGMDLDQGALSGVQYEVVKPLTAEIANWKELNAGSTNAGMDTDSPTIGDGTPDNADDAWIAGRFGTAAGPESVTLAVGETLTVAGSVTLTGGDDFPDNFRFGVFDDGGQFAANDPNNWSGGWIVRGDSGGLFQARTDGVFVSTDPNAVDLPDTITTTGGAFDGDSATAYDWTLSITRDSDTTVDLFASLTGGDNAYDQTFTASDVTSPVFTYTAVGVLFGGSLNLDQGALADVRYWLTGRSSSGPKVTSFMVSGTSATVVMEGDPGVDYYCAGSPDLVDWSMEVVPTDTPGSPFQTDANGDLTFALDVSGLAPNYFFRVQEADPSP